jgi:hypothetical protein
MFDPASPKSPTSPTSSVKSDASTASTASTQDKNLTAKSPVVQSLARLLSTDLEYKKSFLNLLVTYIHHQKNDKINKKFTSKTKAQTDRYDCYQSIIDDKIIGGNCGGWILPADIPMVFNALRELLENFKFPDASKGTEPAVSLPMLEFASDSDLTSMISYRAGNTANDIRKCTFKMGMVDKMSFVNIKYVENTSVDTPDTPDAAPQIGYDPLLEFLIKNNVVNKELGYEPTLMFNLGFIQKPTVSNNGVRPLEVLDRLHVHLSFMRTTDRGTNLLIILVIDRVALDSSHKCNFKIIEVTGDIINKWTWSGKINNLTFYPTCQPSATASGGRKRRRSSKTKKVRARSTRRRHNIKKLKRSVYVKVGNTKRKIRRFRH